MAGSPQPDISSISWRRKLSRLSGRRVQGTACGHPVQRSGRGFDSRTASTSFTAGVGGIRQTRPGVMTGLEGAVNPGGHAKKCKGLRDFLQGQGGRYRGRTAFALRRRATDLITKFAFAKTRRRTPVGWTPNCTVPLRETRSNGGPVEYRQVARLCGFEPRTPDHFDLPRVRAYRARGAGLGLRQQPGAHSVC